MENRDLQVRTFLNANGTPFYPKTRWSAIIDAPDVEGIISDILVGGNYVSDANYVHTDNNFTNVLKEKLDSLKEDTLVLTASYMYDQFQLSRFNPDFEVVYDKIASMRIACELCIYVVTQETSDYQVLKLKSADGFNLYFSNTKVDGLKVRETVVHVPKAGYPNSATISFNDFTLPSQTGNNGKFLTTNGTTAFWAEVVSGSSSMSQLTDVNLTNLQNGQILKYDSALEKWVNSVGGGGVDDFVCNFTSPDNGNTIVCDKTVNEIYTAYNTGKHIVGIGDFSSVFGVDIFKWMMELTSVIYEETTTIVTFNCTALMPLIGAANLYISGTNYEGGDNWEYNYLYVQEDKNKLNSVEYGAEVNVNADWDETNTDDPAYIKNKPTIPSGTVTSVGISVPTGLSVSGTPVTSSGTIAISLANGYSIPTTEKQGEWDAKQSVIDSTHKLSADYIEDGTTNKVINVKPDWNAASGNAAEILNKPAIHNIPAGGNAGQILKKTSATDYDVNWANASETLPSAYCTTSGSTAAKKANCSLYVTQANQYLQVLIGSANTYQGALTLNINSAGAKPIYINGLASSSSNYTLPNGTYFVFYDGTNYYFRTDGKLPMKSADFSGSYTELADKPTIPDAVSGLTDTSISSPSDGQMLKYDNSSSKWVNANVPTELPSVTGNASKILAVNSGATGVEWITNSGGGLSDYNFTHIANTTVSTSTTITFAANTRGSQMVSTAADLSVTFAVNNSSDNYLWIKNTGSSDIDITIYAVTHNSSSVSNVYIPDDGISVPAGKVCEIGIVCNADGAFITSRSDLSL